MKRKFLSTLLFGALACTTLSTVTSCKDYDDDINSLQSEQASLLSKIEALQKSADAATTSIAAAQSTANDALSKANANATEIAAVKTAAAEAGTKAASAAADAAEAKQKAQAALDAIGDVNIKALASKVADLEEKAAGLEELKTGLADLKDQIAKAATKEDLDKAQAKLNSYDNWFNSVFTMVTGVELYGTFTGNAATIPTDKKPALDLMYGTVKEDSKFGDEVAWATITPETFTKGGVIKTDEGIIVRVTPVNADLSKSKVLLINSKGESLSDYIEVSNAKRYDKLLTRGTNIQSGLWNLNLQLKDGVDVDAFKKAVTDPEDKDKKVLFAVAVNNTDTVATYNGDNRWVPSTCDLTLGSHEYESTKVLNFKAGNIEISQLHNRWNGSEATTGTVEHATEVKPAANFTTAVEYKWKPTDSENKYPTPATGIVVENGKLMNVEADHTNEGKIKENRSGLKALPVAVNVPFTVALTPTADDTDAKKELAKVKSYYVVLDKDFAFESAPSEWNAWKEYSIEGINTIVKSTDDLKITIKSAAANGDYIGFRLYAVNYDGTLVDPDGRAFYVKVGNDATAGTLVGNATVTKTTAGVFGFETDYIPVTSEFQSLALKNGTVTFERADFDKDAVKSAANAEIEVKLYKEDKKSTVSDWKDAKFAKITLKDPTAFADGETFEATYEAKDDDNRVVNTLAIKVTKVMPTAAPYDVTFKTNQLNADGSYTCYVDPINDNSTLPWNSAATSAFKNLNKAVNNLNDGNFKWVIENAMIKDKKWANKLKISATGSNEYNISISETEGDDARLSALVDNKTAHASTLTYTYPNISYHKKDGKWDTDHSYPVTVEKASVNIIFACELDPSLQTWKFIEVPQIKDGNNVLQAASAVNWIKYGSKIPAEGVKGFDSESKIIKDQAEIADFISGANSHNTSATFNTKFGGCNLYVSPYECHLNSDGAGQNGVDEYYSVTFDGTKFEFTPNSSATQPTADVPSHLVVKVKDAFGHENEIMNLPFTVKK